MIVCCGGLIFFVGRNIKVIRVKWGFEERVCKIKWICIVIVVLVFI